MGFDSLNLGHVTDDFAVAPQLAPSDMEPLRSMGYRSVMILRPDAEVPGQPNHVQVSDAARAAGLQARYLPIVASSLGPRELKDFELNCKVLPAPMVAYCASGRRAIVLWALTQRGKMPVNEILDHAVMAGHDISGLAAALE